MKSSDAARRGAFEVSMGIRVPNNTETNITSLNKKEVTVDNVVHNLQWKNTILFSKLKNGRLVLK